MVRLVFIPCSIRHEFVKINSEMEESRPSRTAFRVAMRRAAHQILDRPLVFEDPLALRILDGETRDALESNPAELDSGPGRAFRAFFTARARYAEDQLARAVENGVRQFVVLGAGLDTFAYRNPYAGRGLRIFEVDHPAIQAWKRHRLEQAGIAIPDLLTFAPVNFEHQTLESGLREVGFDFANAAFFSWLGVIPYLTREAFRSTLSVISALPSGTGVAFDYGVDPKLLTLRERLGVKMLANRVAAANEPFRLFFTPDELSSELRSTGFHRMEDLSSHEINALYFANRPDDLRIVSNAGHLASAWL
jgi:methyltransferase (TIGR00027 family)